MGPPKPMRSSERGEFPSFSSQSTSTSAGLCNIPIQSALVFRVVRHSPLTWEQLLIGHRPALEPDSKRARTQFLLHAKAFSYAQRTIVADSTSVITWYDYDKLAKCDPGDRYWAPILTQIK